MIGLGGLFSWKRGYACILPTPKPFSCTNDLLQKDPALAHHNTLLMLSQPLQWALLGLPFDIYTE